MKHFFPRSPQSLISSIALWTSFLNFLSSDFCYTQNSGSAPLEAAELFLGNQDESKYTVNFNHVPVVEVIRFVSKITHTNFVFEENDLQFNVTIISEEPISVKNILAALIQILRIHDLRLLEQDNNLMITKNASVNQISTLVSAELPHSLNTQAPIVTRVFRIKNANPASIAAIIKPMVSSSSIIEVSAETRQLIITDLSTNIDKIAGLLVSLDMPNTRLEIESYVVKHIAPSDIISLTQQILSAFAEGNPLILVPQQETNTVFIVSTPYLTEKALTVMEDLDIPPKNAVIGDKGANNQDLHVYKILHKTPKDLLSNLQNIYAQVEENSPGMSSSLLQALKTVKYVQDTDSLIFITDGSTWTKLQDVLAGIDTPFQGSKERNSFWVYKIQNTYYPQIQAGLHQMAQNVQDKDLSRVIDQMKWIKENNTLVFNGPEYTLNRLKEILPTIDVSSQKGQQYYLFKVSHASGSSIRASLEKLANTLQDANLVEIIRHNMQWIEESHSLIFNGPSDSIDQLKTILPMLDVSPSDVGDQSYIYQVQHASENQILSALNQMANGLRDKNLIEAIQNVKWIKENNSLLFNGTSDTLAKLQNILPSLDFASPHSLKSNFIIYTPKNQKGETLYDDLKKISSNLSQSGLENIDFIDTLNSAKWTPSINAIMITGDQVSLDRVQQIVQDLDKETGAELATSQVFLYSPQFVSSDELKDSLARLQKNLNPSDPSNQSLIQTIQSVQWIPESNSFLFRLDEATLVQLKQILATLDNSTIGAASNPHNFYLYKLQQAPGNIVIQNLKTLTENISSDEPRNAGMIKTIKGLKWVKENNAILITGSSQSIELVKALISEFDVPSGQGGPSAKTEFFVYKPTSQTPEQIQTSLDEFSKDLEYSNLNDEDFIHTLKSARFVPASKSLLFTGTPDSLAKLKSILVTVDVSNGHPTPIQKIGNTTFLIYKIQNTPATELINSLQTFSKQLGKSDIHDKSLAVALDSVKWIKETNSLLFIGNENTLQKVETVIAKFDLTSLQSTARTSAASFFVYNPKHQSGDELIHILNEFKQNLVHSGVADSDLFDAIDHLKFIEKTNSLIISGSDAAIEKIKSLLEKFDVLGQGGTPETAISSINDTNFLIYKLQYHKGLEIQQALKKVALSLGKTEKATSKTLIECIDSLQWIEVTNSLLGTGEANTLEKVKGLIHNLDVPLKQVFIEVLVIQTTLNNSQTFGLQWGSQLQYLNKTIGAMGNFPGSPSNILQTPISLTTAGNPPVQGSPSTNSVPFTNGFDLGVIGDIIFHKGQSFLSLGSLLNAIQTDSDSNIVMNPKIMTQDGHTSNIFVGQNVPFVGSFVSNTQQNTVETSNIEYRDVGFNLVVTPTLGTNDIITLDINQVISSVVPGTSTAGSTTVNGITTNNTTMTTRVHVPDRHFLVLSGMISDTKTHTKQGLPCLGGLPMVGALFSQNQITDAKNNIIIFMKPYILHSMTDLDHLTDQEETLFKNEAVLPDLKEAIDAGIETIKNIE